MVLSPWLPLTYALLFLEAVVLQFNKYIASLTTPLTTASTTDANWIPPAGQAAVKLDRSAVCLVPGVVNIKLKNAVSSKWRPVEVRHF